MSKTDLNTLSWALAEIREKQVPHRYYRHIKSGGVYRVWCVSLREEDLVGLVTYHPIDDVTGSVLFTRPLAEFKEKFEPAPMRRVAGNY